MTLIERRQVDLDDTAEGDLMKADARLAKPCNMQDLLGTVHRLLAEQVKVPSGG